MTDANWRNSRGQRTDWRHHAVTRMTLPRKPNGSAQTGPHQTVDLDLAMTQQARFQLRLRRLPTGPGGHPTSSSRLSSNPASAALSGLSART